MLGKMLFIKLATAPSFQKAAKAGGRREKKLCLFLCSTASWHYITQGSCTALYLLFCRYARYYKRSNGEEQRTLFKVYGIRFDVLVFGTVNAILFPCGGRRKFAISFAPLLPYTPLLSSVHHSGMEAMSDE